jgi:hypothetical protein
MDFSGKISEGELQPETFERSNIEDLRARLINGDVHILRRAINQEVVGRIKSYLERVGRSTLPNYQAIDARSPNFVRLNNADPRSYVLTRFQQFSFFPWNADYFDLFSIFRPIFEIKNVLSNLERDSFLGAEPQNGCVSRLSFQFYPSGGGFMNTHRDPVDRHQLVVPIVALTKKGQHFRQGGGFVCDSDGRKVNTDEDLNIGDALLFHAQLRHGVDPVDPEEKLDWLAYQGRWIVITAVNKLASTTDIGNATDEDR